MFEVRVVLTLHVQIQELAPVEFGQRRAGSPAFGTAHTAHILDSAVAINARHPASMFVDDVDSHATARATDTNQLVSRAPTAFQRPKPTWVKAAAMEDDEDPDAVKGLVGAAVLAASAVRGGNKSSAQLPRAVSRHKVTHRPTLAAERYKAASVRNLDIAASVPAEHAV